MGDLLYVKRCLGEAGASIDIYKFRTMCVDADERLEALAGNGFDSFGKILNDTRITPLGRLLRRYWIDELPQLYNLGRGDLKLVGIRPRSEVTWERYPSDIMERALQQKPGLFGIQYAFPHSDTFENELVCTDEYLTKWNYDPAKTDREYLSRIVTNIVLRGIRSS